MEDCPIEVICSGCGAKLEADASWLGERAECPGCGEEVVIRDTSGLRGDLRVCPHCGTAPTSPEARICTECGTDLATGLPVGLRVAAESDGSDGDKPTDVVPAGRLKRVWREYSEFWRAHPFLGVLTIPLWHVTALVFVISPEGWRRILGDGMGDDARRMPLPLLWASAILSFVALTGLVACLGMALAPHGGHSALSVVISVCGGLTACWALALLYGLLLRRRWVHPLVRRGTGWLTFLLWMAAASAGYELRRSKNKADILVALPFFLFLGWALNRFSRLFEKRESLAYLLED